MLSVYFEALHDSHVQASSSSVEDELDKSIPRHAVASLVQCSLAEQPRPCACHSVSYEGLLASGQLQALSQIALLSQ